MGTPLLAEVKARILQASTSEIYGDPEAGSETLGIPKFNLKGSFTGAVGPRTILYVRLGSNLPRFFVPVFFFLSLSLSFLSPFVLVVISRSRIYIQYVFL